MCSRETLYGGLVRQNGQDRQRLCWAGGVFYDQQGAAVWEDNFALGFGTQAWSAVFGSQDQFWGSRWIFCKSADFCKWLCHGCSGGIAAKRCWSEYGSALVGKDRGWLSAENTGQKNYRVM